MTATAGPLRGDRVRSEAADDGSLSTPPAADRATPSPSSTGRPDLSHAVGWLFVVLGFLIGSRPISDNSFLTHFANGRLIWNGAGIPRVDPYSFSAAGEPVTVQSWLASWVYVGLAQNIGDWSLRFFNGLLCALLVASLWKMSSNCRQLFPRVAMVGAGIVVGAGLWTPRPLLFGLLGLCVVLHVIRQELPPWLLLPAMWVWVNSHGSFPIAFVLVATIGLGQYIDDLRSGERNEAWFRRLPWHELRVFGWVGLGTLLGAANPLGARLLWFPIELLSRSEALENVAEWQSPTFRRPHEWGFALLILAALVALKRRAAWRTLVPAAVFIAAGLMAYRNLPLASIVLIALVTPWLENARFTIDGRIRGLVPTAMRALAVAGLVLLTLMTVQQGAMDLRRYPVEEVDWLEQRDLVANPEVHLIQRDTVGNYLEFRYGSQAHVFMDDRFDFYPLDVLRDHDLLIFGGDYAQVLERHDAEAVLWQNEGEFADWLRASDSWDVAYETPLGPDSDEPDGEGWIVACRVGSPAHARCR